MRLANMLVVAAIVIGCDYFRVADPGVDIQVVRQGDDYLFSFKTCWDQRIGIPWINVIEGTAGGGEAPAHCELSTRDASVKAISGPWKYGHPPPGYEMKVCKALVPGTLYEVQVVGAGGGRRVFYVRPDGSVELREGTCSKKPAKP